MVRRRDGQGLGLVADSVNVAVVERCRVEEDVSVIILDGGKVLAVKKCDGDDSRSVTG